MFELFIYLLLFTLVLTLTSILLGNYIYLVFTEKEIKYTGFLERLWNICLKIIGKDCFYEMNWKEYASRFMLFNLFGIIFLYLILRIQDILPLNGDGLSAIVPAQALNIAISFATNTNWQVYSGEAATTNFVQSIGFCSQNFLSAASGIAVLFALIRGFIKKEEKGIGNFWRDLVRSITLILLPLSLLLSFILVFEGVPQTLESRKIFTPLEQNIKIENQEKKFALGPVASQVAIKQLGTNGGGFYNANSAHPLENPTPFSNFIQCLSILLIPGALCFAFGQAVKSRGHSWVLYGSMLSIFIVFTIFSGYYEINGFEDSATKIFGENSESVNSKLGNLEGKEVRIGIPASVIWANATTAASNGSVNSMHDSYMPLGGLFPMILMQLGEVVFGGVGSGLYGMLAFAIITVFISGLLVGRTPEFLGKKIGAFEIKMVSIVVLVPCILSLGGTAIGVMYNFDGKSTLNSGAHGFSEILYAYSSMGNNNGSAFGGFSASFDVHCILGAISMFLSRYLVAIPIIALAGSLANKKMVEASNGTLPTNTVLFSFLLISVVLLLGALTFFPALVLGPIAEHMEFVN